MARPIKLRKVQFVPKNTYFIPYSKRDYKINDRVEEVKLKFEEVEAMRLKDIEGLSQEESAKKMEVSRQTFQNIIDEARKKVALALINGYALSIEGGHYTKCICKFKCISCHSEYELAFEKVKGSCVICSSERIVCRKRSLCDIKCSRL